MANDLDSKEIISKETIKVASDGANPAVQTIDLNAELGDNADKAPSTTDAAAASSMRPTSEVKSEEYPGWSLPEMDKMAFDPLHFAQLNTKLDDDEEDYDEEG
ncbi:hypothetical protein Acr_01g0010150 [Actinidia rufa]|uniref:Uncharacterized protein n=1 Tax=Actinidia rufa TaxID=165716 RepID=A0A7J0E4V1_9ERIC|nr:hypothetical protein Acr_01g0010150 [Actinidia rufa]